MTYLEKLKDPRWQKRRLELFEAANWTCKECGTKTETLHAHHGYYKRRTDPLDYPNDVMHVLCEKCHADMQEYMEDSHLVLGRLPKYDLFLVTELVHALQAVPQIRCKILYLFSDVIRAGIHYDFTIKEEEFGYGWLMHSTLGAVAISAEQRGYGEGALKAEAKDAATTA